MKKQKLRLLTIVTTILLLIFAVWYLYLHRYRVGTSTPDALVFTGMVAGLMSSWLFLAGIGAWKRKRSPLAIAATVIGGIMPGLFVLFILVVLAISPFILPGH